MGYRSYFLSGMKKFSLCLHVTNEPLAGTQAFAGGLKMDAAGRFTIITSTVIFINSLVSELTLIFQS